MSNSNAAPDDTDERFSVGRETKPKQTRNGNLLTEIYRKRQRVFHNQRFFLFHCSLFSPVSLVKTYFFPMLQRFSCFQRDMFLSLILHSSSSLLLLIFRCLLFVLCGCRFSCCCVLWSVRCGCLARMSWCGGCCGCRCWLRWVKEGFFVLFTRPFLSFRPLLSSCQAHTARRVARM